MIRFDQDTLVAHTVPALFARGYLSLAAEHGHAMSEVLDLAGITPAQGLSEQGWPVDDYARLIIAISALLGPIGIGIEMGWRMPPTAMGSLGAAVLSSATGRDALAVCQRFWHFYGIGLTLDVAIDNGVCTLAFHTQPALVPDTHRPSVLEGAVAGFVRGITGMQRIAPQQLTVWFDFDEPVYAERVRRRLGDDVHWGMPTCCIRLPAHLLDEPLPQASPLALQDALRQCEQAERLLGKRTDEVAERVRRELVLQDDGYPSLEAVAERLSMSTRTLRRRLQEQGLGFMDLLLAARRRDALSLLERQALEVAQVAQMLGYADPANFTRAFRQWTGQTPSAWRASFAARVEA